MTGRNLAHGFTLIELIVVIVLSGIVATLVARNISQPIQAFVDTARRAALVDAAETALDRVTREVRLALPNSVRIDGGTALEFLRTRTGGRYRAEIDPGLPGSDKLDFTNPADTAFDVLGEVKQFGQIHTGAADCMADRSVDCLVIYNTGEPSDCTALASGRTNAYCGDNVASITNVDVGGRKLAFNADLPGPGGFAFASPNQRFYVVDTPVSFVCDLALHTLTRYDGYSIAAVQATPPPAANGQVLAENVAGCRFEYDAGSSTRAALIAVSLTLRDSDAVDEGVSLLQQIHVEKAP